MSGDRETVILGFAGRGVIERLLLPVEEPDSNDALRAACGERPEGRTGVGAGDEDV